MPAPATIVIFDDAAVEQVAVDLRQRTTELKKKASTSRPRRPPSRSWR
jgi:hypothetical protein